MLEPERALELVHFMKSFYFLDEKNSVHKSWDDWFKVIWRGGSKAQNKIYSNPSSTLLSYLTAEIEDTMLFSCKVFS